MIILYAWKILQPLFFNIFLYFDRHLNNPKLSFLARYLIVKKFTQSAIHKPQNFYAKEIFWDRVSILYLIFHFTKTIGVIIQLE